MILPELDAAARLFGERNRDFDPPPDRRYNLEGACLSKAALLEIQGFRHVWMAHARLFRVDLRSADLRNTDLRDARAGVVHIDIWSSIRASYPDPMANPVREMNKDKNYYELSQLRADLSNSNFSSAWLGDASFEGADFHDSTFAGTSLEGTHLEMATLHDAKFIPNEDSHPANLTDAHLAMADGEDAKFNHAILVRADFTGAVLKRVDFSHADLTDAVFQNADLEDAIFDGAIVTRTNFENAKGLNVAKIATACVDAACGVASQPKGMPGGSIPRCPAASSTNLPVWTWLYGLRKQLWRDPSCLRCSRSSRPSRQCGFG
jgi:uncharacterized protein YjbI with pentapeptide repeats